MKTRRFTPLSAVTKRPAVALAILAAVGIALSAAIGREEKRQYEAIEQLRLAGMVDVHLASVQDHLAFRENLATVVSTLFTPPPLSTARPLGGFGAQMTALVPDIQTLGWVPEVKQDQIADALSALRDAGMNDPHFIGRDNEPLSASSLSTLGRPLYPLLDVLPPQNRFVLGVETGSFPDRLAAIRRARDTRHVARTSVLRLVQAPETSALLLYAPVFSKEGDFLGVLGFGYRVDRLFASAFHGSKVNPAFEIDVYDQDDPAPLIVFSETREIRSAPSSNWKTSIERSARFGGRALRFVYRSSRDLAYEGLWYGVRYAAAGITLTALALLLIGFMGQRAASFAREVEQRRSAEDRMKVLIHELNHRVRNVLSVAQAIVRLSFTSGYNLAEVQKTCEGRLLALANAMSLLTASDWKGIGLRSLITDEILPFAERITVQGEDLPLKARAAQTFALLLYELATNAAKHGAFSSTQGKVLLRWTIDRSDAEPIFRLKWQETDGPPTVAPTRRGFGELLLRRIAPRDVAGRGHMSYAAEGFTYELEAPLREIRYEGETSATA